MSPREGIKGGNMKIEIRENHKNAYDTTTIKILEKVLRKYAEIKKPHCVDYEILDDQETYNIVSFEEEFGLSQDVDFGFESSPSAVGAISIRAEGDRGLVLSNEGAGILIELRSEAFN